MCIGDITTLDKKLMCIVDITTLDTHYVIDILIPNKIIIENHTKFYLLLRFKLNFIKIQKSRNCSKI